MQTTLVKLTTKEIEEHLTKRSDFLAYFLDRFAEWKKLKLDSSTSESLKRFETQHGSAFVQLLTFFEHLLEEHE